MQEMQVWSLSQEDPLEKEMATHSSILVWKTPWTEEPGGLQFMESQGVRHDWSDWACWRLKPGRQPLRVVLSSWFKSSASPLNKTEYLTLRLVHFLRYGGQHALSAVLQWIKWSHLKAQVLLDSFNHWVLSQSTYTKGITFIWALAKLF